MSNTSYVTSVTVCGRHQPEFRSCSTCSSRQTGTPRPILPIQALCLFDTTDAKWCCPASFLHRRRQRHLHLDAAAPLPNFNGIQKVRVLGYDSTGNTFVLDLNQCHPGERCPPAPTMKVSLVNGDRFVFGLPNFGFTDRWGNAFKSVVVSSGSARHADPERRCGYRRPGNQASDIEAGKLTFSPGCCWRRFRPLVPGA